jgi:hypothetical protein
MRKRLPNKRVKRPRPLLLRRRASRPQLKRDPLGSVRRSALTCDPCGIPSTSHWTGVAIIV